MPIFEHGMGKLKSIDLIKITFQCNTQIKCETNCLKCSRKQLNPKYHNGNTNGLACHRFMKSPHTTDIVLYAYRIRDRVRHEQKYGLFCLHLAFIDTQNMAATLVNHSCSAVYCW